jgi:predicted O-methyltransferase YrrM
MPMFFENCTIGSYNFNVLKELLKEMNILVHNVGVEVGVLDGGTSWYLLQNLPSLRLISVDPYKAYVEYDQARMNQAEYSAFQRLSPFGERSIRIKEDSVTASRFIEDGCLDFVFIDGDHSYEGVKSDIAAWYNKVRPGGLFCGHDYSWPGVNRAVHEFAEEHKLEGFSTPMASDIWGVRKPQ